MRSMKRIPFFLLTGFLLFSSCEESEPDFDELYKVDRIASVQMLFESISRNPEAADNLIRTAENIAGYSKISDLAPIGECISREFGYARGDCIAACAEAIVRQPEFSETLIEVAEKFLGTSEDPEITSDINDYSRVRALPGILESIARQPEELNKINQMSLALLGVDLTEE